MGATLNEKELITHCRATLAHFKVPKRVFFVDALPKGGTAKILKRELRERFAREPSDQPEEVTARARP